MSALISFPISGSQWDARILGMEKKVIEPERVEPEIGEPLNVEPLWDEKAAEKLADARRIEEFKIIVSLVGDRMVQRMRAQAGIQRWNKSAGDFEKKVSALRALLRQS